MPSLGRSAATMAFCVGMAKQPIYLVDQDDVVRDSLKVLLESNGFEVEDFRSIAGMPRDDGLGRAGCLVLGFNHHIRGGLEFTGALEKGSQLPVIFIVGRGEPATRAAAIRAGAFAYLERPVKESLLLFTIRNALQTRRQGLAASGTKP